MSLILNTFCEHTDYVSSLAMLDSETFISGSFDHTIKLWNIHQSTSLCTYYDTYNVNCLHVLDSNTFISENLQQQKIKIWDKNKNEPIRIYDIKIDSIAVFPDGEHFIVSCFETIKLFSKNSESVLREYKGDIIYKDDIDDDDDDSYSIITKVLPDGIHFISVSMASDFYVITITLWNKEQESPLYKYIPQICSNNLNIEIFDNENILINGSDEVYMFNIYNKTILRRYNPNDRASYSCYMKALDSKTFIIGEMSNTIRIWNVDCENQPTAIYQGPQFKDDIFEYEYSTSEIIMLDSKTFISGNENGNIVLWNHD